MTDSKKYDGSQWEHSLRKLTTATEAVENPLYSDGTAITTYTIKGNTVQTGTPTPSAPISVNGVGELETSGEHTGEYKIPISSGGMTTNIYLGSTQTTRRIGKYIFDGSNIFTTQRSTYRNNTALFTTTAMTSTGVINRPSMNNYFVVPSSGINPQTLDYACSGFHPADQFSSYYYLRVPYDVIGMTDSNTDNEFITALNTWLSSLYNSGNPMITYYALATPETAAVNEPLMKIGDYADTLSNAASIPTTEGANSITVDTTVQPSEFTATWTGWHNANVKEWDGSAWS